MSETESGRNPAQIKEVLRAIRRITRAVDIQSKQVTKAVGLTVPQLVILQAIRDNGPVTSKRLAEEASLSPATLVTILDKLEGKGLVERRRDSRDRRAVYSRLTAAGETALNGAPPLLHAAFSTRFSSLPPERQREIIAALGAVAEMLGTGRLDAAPVLDGAPL
ncbi:winged helix-turn-helix transcriptional regulator [Stappia sp. F7233]|uniref:Winged helix-turn-helix transcriptional regulator n=1 Tax=Stappia albiluteola TaxID=2758565 RepID=A0A839AHI8_9HYPH|nr:MarR family winged helix-turn-helix transcriptional regulator [Stappia albiluteola]MBA5778498.1 winged helix-turn-helix transcriptional regulator [Stappia albiluteola]